MAVFNPSPGQTSDPNYLGWSKAIEQPSGDKSAAFIGEAAKDLSSGVVDIVQGIDKSIKIGLDDQIHDSVDTIRQRYTNELSQAKDMITGVTQQNLFTPTTADVPLDLQNLDGRLQSIQNLKNTLNLRGNNHASETLYRMELDTLAKDFRGRWRGYTDYIDEKFKSITGSDPANAVVQSLIGDINASLTKSHDEREKLIHEIDTHPYMEDKAKNLPGSAAIAQYLRNGGDVNVGRMWLQQRIGQENSYKAREAEIKAQDAENKTYDNNGRYEALAITIANQMFANNFQDMDVGGGKKLPDIMKLVGTGSMSDQQGTVIGQIVDRNTIATEAAVRQRLYATDADGNSIASRITDKRAQEIINDAKSMHTHTSSLFQDKDKGAATFHFRMGTAVANDAYYEMLGNKDLRTMSAMLGFLRRAGGDNVFQTTILDQWNGSKLPDSTKDAVSMEKMQGYTQMYLVPNPGSPKQNTLKPRPVDKPYTSNDFLDAADTRLSQGDPKIKAQIYREFPKDTVQIMLSPDDKVKPEMKINTAHMLFGPGSEGAASRFISSQGGLFNVFSQWTSPEMTTEIKRLDAKSPGLFDQYKSWTERSFVQLYNKHMASVEQLDTYSKDFKILYNSQTGQLETIRNRTPSDEKDRFFGRDQRDPMAVKQKIDAELINPLNTGLRSMAGLARATGEKDVHLYLLKVLQQNGVDVDKIKFLGDATRIPEKSRFNYSDETQGTKPKGPTLDEFLKNPVGHTNAGFTSADIISSGQPVDLPPPPPVNELIRRQRESQK